MEEPMMATLDRAEIELVLSWANGCDGESFLTAERDWPLVKTLAQIVGQDPAKVAPGAAWEVDEIARWHS
jgi:hypothetical protein